MCKLGCGVNVELPGAGFKLSMAWVSDSELEDDWLIRHLGWSKRLNLDELQDVIANRKNHFVASAHIPEQFQQTSGKRCVIARFLVYY
jgi:hypothetical protein